MTAQTASDRRKRTAYHEAGHAVVAYDQGVRIHGISIVPDQRRGGHIRIDTLLLDRLVPTFRSDKGARNRFTMERHVMVLLGGYCAVARLYADGEAYENPDRQKEGSDRSTALNLLRAFTPDEQEVEKYYEWLKARANGIIHTPQRWYQLERLAEALLSRDRLGAREVRDTLRDAAAKWTGENGAAE